jgi:NAD(P)-dependent dehydrogenase (short-subunit alcohol dehydrogenase family)
MTDDRRVPEADWQACLRVLARVADDPRAAPDGEALERAVARLYKRARKARRKESGHERKAHDRAEVERVLRQREAGEVAPAEPVRLEAGARHCYVCHARYRDLDARYHLLCPACAALHEEKRRQRADLAGRRALVTGGRAGIGRAVALRLLRDGAEVVVTTRFAEAARRAFAAEPDHTAFAERLTVVALELEDLDAVERFAADLAKRPLDILVNNAALSVAYPAERVARLAAAEPVAEDDDPRDDHGWLYAVDEVPLAELRAVLRVNAAAPLLLVGRLRPALAASPNPSRFIVNVTGLDGEFGRAFKSTRHVHVNMSKAALNMLTRTAAADLAAERIFLCSVDAGWVTHEGRASTRRKARAQGFLPPLDEIDAASRIYDPIVRGLAGDPVHGVLLKDYRPAAF